MAEKYRIDLGYDPLFGSQSIDPDASAGTNKTVVYDTANQTFYYTGSYSSGGGAGTTTGSFTGSFTGSISASVSDIIVQSVASNTYFPVTLNENAGTSGLKQDPIDFKYNPNLDTLIVDGTISASNFINVGTVANTKLTGSFTGSFDGTITSASFATVAAGLVHTPDVIVGAITASSITASGDIFSRTGSFDYLESDQIIGHTGDANTGIQFAEDTVIINSNNVQVAKFRATDGTIIGNDSYQLNLSGSELNITPSITASGDISASGGTITGLNYINNGTVANTKLTGSFTGSFTGDGSGLSGVGAGFPFTGSAAISGTLSLDGPAGHITASGNISASGDVIANETFLDNMGSLKFANGTSNEVRLRGQNGALMIGSSSFFGLAINPGDGHITSSGNISSSGGTITGLNYINNGTVANTKLTGSFTGSLTGLASNATVAAGLTGTPGITVGAITASSITASGDIFATDFIGSSSAGSAEGNKISMGTTNRIDLLPENVVAIRLSKTQVTLNKDTILYSTLQLDTGSQGSTALGFGGGQIAKFGGGNTLVAGAVVVLKSDGQWDYSDATSDAASTGSLGVALGTDATDGVLMNGFVKIKVLANGASGAIGDPVYLGIGNGRGDVTPPSGTGDVVRIIGHLMSGSTDAGHAMIHFNPSPDFILHA